MSKKFMIRKDKAKDHTQDRRIKKLEDMVLKTMENKQINYSNSNLAISSSGVNDNQFLQVRVGPDDGALQGDNARIGNSLTLYRQQYRFNFVGLNPDDLTGDRWNQVRVIVAEALDGNQALLLADILQYPSYFTSNNLVFTSPYTTKTATNRRYKIHMDKTFELNANAKGATRVIKHDVKWKSGKVIEFDGPGTEQVPTNHNMSILFISDSGSVQHPSCSYSVRSTYKDA
ncbi:MAG: putative capsid protein [Cressdnaviricota sp.]|nr:MAG: putative capsid protein [Cressdnaviricota sp.]